MFKQDKWGNTYFFVDHDFNYDQHQEGPNLAPGGSYLEIARCLNFWQQSGLKNFSLQVEYNGGITRSYPINNAWLFGVDYFIHSKDYKNTLNLKALYKTIRKKTSDVPMQLTAVWAMNDLFGIKGLKTIPALSRMAKLPTVAPYSSPSHRCGTMLVSILVSTTLALAQR